MPENPPYPQSSGAVSLSGSRSSWPEPISPRECDGHASLAVDRPSARTFLCGFTLLELLTVVAIIALLTGVVIGVGRRASDSGKVARAKAELAVISSALESYKRQYGDYPQAGALNFALPQVPLAESHANVRLYNALTGHLGPKMLQLEPRGRAFIELARFSTEMADTGMAITLASKPERNALLDPWGNRYVYYYRSSTAPEVWRNPTYVLYSVGPDGAQSDATEASCHVSPDETGFVDYDDPRNADNIYANRRG